LSIGGVDAHFEANYELEEFYDVAVSLENLGVITKWAFFRAVATVSALKYFCFAYFLQLIFEIFEAASIDEIQVGGCPHSCLMENTAPLPVPSILAHPRIGVD
jgi:hypothetical protein